MDLVTFYQTARQEQAYESALPSRQFRESDGSHTIGPVVQNSLAFLDHYWVHDDQSFCGQQVIVSGGMPISSSFVDQENNIRWRPYVQGGEVVWHNQYEGRIFPALPNQRVTIPDYQTNREADFLFGHVLKPALRLFPEGRPFQRGPERFDGGHWPGQLVYRCICNGDMREFENTETIQHWVSRNTIYLYEDHGGLGPLPDGRMLPGMMWSRAPRSVRPAAATR